MRKKIKKIDLTEYHGYIHRGSGVNTGHSIEEQLLYIQDKINEIIDIINSEE